MRIFIFLIFLLHNSLIAQTIESDLIPYSVVTSMDYVVNSNNLNDSSENYSPNGNNIVSNKYELASLTRNKVSPKNNKNSLLKRINGFILNSHTNIPIPNVVLKVFYDSEEVYNTFSTDDKGFFEFEVPINNQFFIEAKHKQFNVRYKKIVYFDKKQSDFFKIYLIPLLNEVIIGKREEYKSIDIKNIPVKSRKGKIILDMPELFFDIDEDQFKAKQNRKTINNIIDILLMNPYLVLEISSHTDSRGPKLYLLDLSYKRAKSIRNYITSKGIEFNRIEIKGNGSSSLLIDCETKKKCSAKQHLVNKRTEFVILNPISSEVNEKI